MLFAPVIAAVGMAAAGSIMGANQAKKAAKKQKKAYQMASALMKDATEKYSGAEADRQMRNEGDKQATILNNLSQNRGALNSNMSINNALGAANRAAQQDATLEGINLGRENAAKGLSAGYNAAANQANMYLNNAQIENAVEQQKYQNLMSGLSSGLQAANNLGITQAIGGQFGLGQQIPGQNNNNNTSDERMKEAPSETNEGENDLPRSSDELPQADVEDALRQIESVEYEYKDPDYPGSDDEEHVGFTAQSLEDTAFGDAVSEDENGVKKVDQWRLMESIMAGISCLQREIDELENESVEKDTEPEKVE